MFSKSGRILADSKTLHVLRCYYGFQFFFPLLLWLPVFYEVQKRVGLDDGAIFQIQTLYYLAFVLLEVPTGFFSDRFGWKNSLVLGSASLILSSGVPFFPSYAGFLGHFLLVACARALVSGAASAYVYEFLRARNQGDLYKTVEGRTRAFGLMGKVLGWAVVGSMTEWFLFSSYFLTGVFGIAALYFSIRLSPDRSFVARPHELPLIPRFTQALASFRNPVLLLLVMQGAGLFVLGRMIQVNLFQPLLLSNGFDLAHLGWLMSWMTLVEASASYLADRLPERVDEVLAVTLLTIFGAMSMYLFGGIGKLGAFGGLSLAAISLGLAYPLQRKVMNDAIRSSSCRATILSIESMADRLLCAGASSAAGFFLARGQLNDLLWFTGTTVCLIAIVVQTTFGVCSASATGKSQGAG